MNVGDVYFARLWGNVNASCQRALARHDGEALLFQVGVNVHLPVSKRRPGSGLEVRIDCQDRDFGLNDLDVLPPPLRCAGDGLFPLRLARGVRDQVVNDPLFDLRKEPTHLRLRFDLCDGAAFVHDPGANHAEFKTRLELDPFDG